MTRWERRAALACIAATLAGVGCSRPVLTREGRLVFAEGGARGASVLTANGVEFLDVAEVPAPVIRRSTNEPWQPSTGFLLPKSGVWRETSRPVAVNGHGLTMVLRSSDHLVPSWGGEVLVRIDALVPAEAFPAADVRPPRVVAVVIDGHSPNIAPLVEVALDNLGQRDRAMIVDAAPARAVLPLVPGAHHTLLGAAVERVAARRSAAASHDLAGALALARTQLGRRAAAITGSVRQVLVVTDGAGIAAGDARLSREVAALRAQGVRLTAIGAPDRLQPDALLPLGEDVFAGGSFEDREDAIAEALPPPGEVVLEDVELTLASAPAPLRVIELSGGQSAITPESDRIFLGELYAGEARTEVARVAVPVWVPGEPLEIEVSATYRDAASGERLSSRSVMRCRYSSDVEKIADARHGDVIAYASALAMVRRLHRAFLGSEIDRVGGLRPVVAWQARSLSALAKAQRDPAIDAQAEILQTLLGAIED
ncbi:MAG TPA: vWA domain-containing protein [Candidatus Nanopelagicales bacterium]|nr:vWA domain-containing protein [Candidatus Nanopelagicales bacterium]